jgi:hypothetical protein
MWGNGETGAAREIGCCLARERPVYSLHLAHPRVGGAVDLAVCPGVGAEMFNKGGCLMKTMLKVVLGVAVAVALVVAVKAADKAEGKEVTKSGKLVCGKCTLKETDECSNVLQVKEDGKTVNYYLDDSGKGEKYHKDICAAKSEKDVKVTGTVSEKDKKKYIKVTKLEDAK